MKTILILEDNGERIVGFQKAVTALGEGLELKARRGENFSWPARCPEPRPSKLSPAPWGTARS